MTVVNKDSFESSEAGLFTSNNTNEAEACLSDNLCYPVCPNLFQKKKSGASAYGLSDGLEYADSDVMARPFGRENWR